jgi:hypothetical protein
VVSAIIKTLFYGGAGGGGPGLNYKDRCPGRLELGSFQSRGKLTDNWIATFGDLLYERHGGGARCSTRQVF